eukprot:1143257-Pelagomonas_calceolata.AAC.2
MQPNSGRKHKGKVTCQGGPELQATGGIHALRKGHLPGWTRAGKSWQEPKLQQINAESASACLYVLFCINYWDSGM